MLIPRFEYCRLNAAEIIHLHAVMNSREGPVKDDGHSKGLVPWNAAIRRRKEKRENATVTGAI